MGRERRGFDVRSEVGQKGEKVEGEFSGIPSRSRIPFRDGIGVQTVGHNDSGHKGDDRVAGSTGIRAEGTGGCAHGRGITGRAESERTGIEHSNPGSV